MGDVPPAPSVFAAGAVVWRVVEGRIRVLIIHRTRRRDTSLPKGKVDPGETLPQTAVREVHEETGLRVALGVPLGAIEYGISGGRRKSVSYWAAEATDAMVEAGRFEPDDEVESVEWVSIPNARKRLDYPGEVQILDLFAGLVETGSHRSFALIALRHGHAVQPYEWDGADASRPLSARGQDEARSIVPTLLAFGPRVVTSSTAERCLQTVAPLAEALGRRVKEDAGISQDAYETDGGSVRATVAKRVRKARSAVLCSHSPVLPEILHEIALATETPRASRMPRAGMLSPAEFSVVHLSASDPEAGILAVETYGPST